MNILEAILPELQKIVAAQNKTNSHISYYRFLTCNYQTIDIDNQTIHRIRIEIDNESLTDPAGYTTYKSLSKGWIDIQESKIIYYEPVTLGLKNQQIEWTDPDLIQKLTQHIKTIASTQTTK